MTLREILRRARVMPVLVVEELEHAVPLAIALRDAGMPCLEITLRRPSAMEAIRRIVGEVEGAVVGAGTVTTASQLRELHGIGAAFAVSPGMTEALVREAQQIGLPYLPGVVTPSEVMRGRELGVDTFKFFPAGAAGGAAMLRSYVEVFAGVSFCPTGGIGPGNAAEYLELANVIAVGTTWVAPQELVTLHDWRTIAHRVATLLGK